MQLWDGGWSEGIAREAVWVSGVVDSYAEGEEVMSRIGRVGISDSSIWRRVKKWGQAFEQLDEGRRERGQAMPNRGEVVAGQERSEGRMGVAIDGANVHIRDEGWKELKVGAVYDLEVYPTYDRQSQEWFEQAHAINNSYVAHLGGPEPIGELLWAEAQARGWDQVYDTQVMGDGAPWIWNLAGQHFFDSCQSIDWYHATDHLNTAATLLFPHDPQAAKRWLKRSETALFQGHADRVATDLRDQVTGNSQRAKDIRTEANYFAKHQRRMQYLEFREEGYLIGSGTVECGAKQFKARFCGPGMRWSRKGLKRLLPVRAAVLSHQFDALWPQVYNSPTN